MIAKQYKLSVNALLPGWPQQRYLIAFLTRTLKLGTGIDAVPASLCQISSICSAKKRQPEKFTNCTELFALWGTKSERRLCGLESSQALPAMPCWTRLYLLETLLSASAFRNIISLSKTHLCGSTYMFFDCGQVVIETRGRIVSSRRRPCC